MTYSFSVIIFHFTIKKQLENHPSLVLHRKCPQSGKGQSLFYFHFWKENIPLGPLVERHPLMSHCPVFHQIPKPKPHTGRGGINMTGLKNQGLSPGTWEETIKHKTPEKSCSQRKWQNRGEQSTIRAMWNGHILTTKALGF